MQPIGRVVNRFSGRLLVKTDAPLQIGTRVFKKDGKETGKVVDVIGNVKSPYIVVETEQAETAEIYSR